ncbi:MAG: hypothetical protein AB1521_01265 [Bacteroidota bacterium]
MSKRIFLYVFALLVLTVGSRIIFTEKIFYDADTIGVALATESFSLEDTRPHLPGYYLHVKAIKLIDYLVGDIHSTMMFVTIFYFCAGAILSFLIFSKYMELKNAFLVMLLIIFNPLVWYQTVTPEVYAFDFFFASLAFLIGNRGKLIYFLPLLFAIATGFRQTSGVLLLPLYIYYWYKFYKSDLWQLEYFIVSHFTAIVVFLLWFIPFTNSTGGVLEYFDLYKTNSPLPRISLLQHLFQFSSYLFYVLLPFVILLIVFLINHHRVKSVLSRIKNDCPLIQLMLWFIPPFLVFTFFTYHKGYFLLIITPLYFVAGILLNKKEISLPITMAILILEILFFIFYPTHDVSLESLYSPSKRNVNIAGVWVDRTFNSYLMAHSRIEKQEQTLADLFEAVNKNPGGTTNKYFFIDPTLNLYARALQIEYTGRKFVTMDQFKKNYFVFYNGIDIEVKQGFYDVIKESILITRKDFYDKELSNYLKKFSSYGNIIRIDDEKVGSIDIIQKYDSLFLR